MGTLSPASGLTPRSTCPHRSTPIEPGQLLVCLVCLKSGMDDHPALAKPIEPPRLVVADRASTKTSKHPEKKLPTSGKMRRRKSRRRKMEVVAA